MELVLGLGAVTLLLALAAVCEMRTGTAVIPFAAFERHTREENPRLFKVRQWLNWGFVAFFGLATLAFAVQVFGIVE